MWKKHFLTWNIIEMDAFLTLFRMQYKRCFATLGKSIAGLIFALFAIAGGVAAVSYTVFQSQSFTQLPVAVSVPKGEGMTRQAVQFVSAMRSMQSICSFEYMSEEQAVEQLEKGKVQAAILFPESFYEDIDSGVNSTAAVYLPEDPPLNVQIFAELLVSGVQMLQTGETAVYANIYEIRKNGAVYGAGQAANLIAACYIENVLSRGRLFEQQVVSATGECNLYQYYFCTFVILLLLICGASFSVLYCRSSRVVEQQLFVYGVGKIRQEVIRIGVMTVILWFTAIFFCALAEMVSEIYGSDFLYLDGQTALQLGMLCCSAAGFIHMCYRFLPGNTHSAIWFLIICMGMVFCSGMLLPLSYLPEWIRPAGQILPFHIWRQFMETILFSDGMSAANGTILGCTALEIGIGALAIWKKS